MKIGSMSASILTPTTTLPKISSPNELQNPIGLLSKTPMAYTTYKSNPICIRYEFMKRFLISSKMEFENN
jgi:hypothetical protein